jgi:hypothetical protein
MDPRRGPPIEANTCGCGDLSARDSCGPLLRFAGFDPASSTWRGSALLVCRAGAASGGAAPTLAWRACPSGNGAGAAGQAGQAGEGSGADGGSSSAEGGDQQQQTVPGELLDSYLDWQAWRFPLAVPVQEGEQVVEYQVEEGLQGVVERFSFFVPGGPRAGNALGRSAVPADRMLARQACSLRARVPFC